MGLRFKASELKNRPKYNILAFGIAYVMLGLYETTR